MNSITDTTNRDGTDVVESADKGMKVSDTPDNSTFRDSSMLRHGSIFGLDPREDNAVFLPRPCILILKVAKDFRKLFFEALN